MAMRTGSGVLASLQSARQNLGYFPVVNSINQYNLAQKGIFYLDRGLRYLRRPELLSDKRPFIFGVGLGKTGTSSLTSALNLLNYKCAHWHYPKAMLRYRDGELLVNPNKLLVDYRAYTDTPIARVYQLLDSAFPHSKFILTVRDEESWFRSHERWVGPSGTGHETKGLSAYLRADLYGSVAPDRETNIAAFRQHNHSVQEYFKDRSNDLLVFDITAGDGWEKLCPFLGIPIPDVPFPKDNVSQKV